tara:strand:+ start:826 stop:1296 length:471 start_codon:yes stop_codon:yes gene_type:complete
MKITRAKLQQIIKEEFSRVLSETSPADADPLENPMDPFAVGAIGAGPEVKPVHKVEKEKKKSPMAKELQRYLQRKASSLSGQRPGPKGRYDAHAEWTLNPDGTDKGVVIHVDDSTSVLDDYSTSLTNSFKIDANRGFKDGKLDKNVLWRATLAFME